MYATRRSFERRYLMSCGWRSTAGAGLLLNELNGSPRLSVARTGEGPSRSWVLAYLRGCEAIVKMDTKAGWTYVFFEFHGCKMRRFFFLFVVFLYFCTYSLYRSALNILSVCFPCPSTPSSSTKLRFCKSHIREDTPSPARTSS
ncbi:hypothetical protein ARMSODRAFT_305916 [Armillaria solidipes]|uniref:Uncharacterized protein n=1 Tax=Armillaria solidipes TaxID=1076256 RepID=A0A2H3B0J5_9AGAR|nr:hypothetical protein ARMSODRAFT_305916 [Armillaria solidipes]